MHNSVSHSWGHVHTIVFDFDGVFTDNTVYVDEDGKESVRCDRADGLAFDMLRRYILRTKWNICYFILSTEKNPVVKSRAEKLQIPCFQGETNKLDFLTKYLDEKNLDPSGLAYVGNDLNDLPAIMLSSISVVPLDAHPLIQKESSIIMPQKGGCGFVRATIEMIMELDQMPLDQLLQLVAPSKQV